MTPILVQIPHCTEPTNLPPSSLLTYLVCVILFLYVFKYCIYIFLPIGITSRIPRIHHKSSFCCDAKMMTSIYAFFSSNGIENIYIFFFIWWIYIVCNMYLKRVHKITMFLLYTSFIHQHINSEKEKEKTTSTRTRSGARDFFFFFFFCTLIQCTKTSCVSKLYRRELTLINNKKLSYLLRSYMRRVCCFKCCLFA